MSSAAVVAAVIAICAAELNRRKRRIWVRKLYQRRQALGCYPTLLRELRDEDPESFRGYLRMDIETFDALLELVEEEIQLNAKYRFPISTRERLAVTLRFLATGD